MSFATRNLQCQTCYIAEKAKKQPAPHNCRRNWYGSSKVMESDVACDLAASVAKSEAGVHYGVLIGDDDAPTTH